MPLHDLSLSVIAIVGLLMCWRWTRTHPDFDLVDLITGDNGRVSTTKFGQTGSWIITTWGFVTLIQQGKMTEWYMAAYLGLTYGVRIVKDIYTPKDQNVQLSKPV